MSPISHASRLAEFGSGIGTHGAVLKVDNDDKRIGIGTTNPQAMLQVGTGVSVYGNVGIVSATEVRADTLRGDGTNITGVVGVGTLNVRTKSVTTSGVSTFAGVTKVTDTTETTSTSTGAVIISGGVGIAKSLRVGTELHVGSNVTIGGTLTYEDVTNIDSVGLVTARSGVNVTGGQIQVGAAFSVGNAGVATAAGFVGPLTGAVTGNVTGNASGTAGGLTGTPNISCGTIAGSTGTFTGDVSIADKIVHTGDTNTAIRFSGNDTIKFETGGAERLMLNSGNIFQQSGTFVIKAASGDSGGLQLSQESSDESRITNKFSGPITFGTNLIEKMRLTSGGALGIGTLGDSIGPTSLLVARNEASGYIASFRGIHASNSAQIIIDSPTDNNTRPSSIDLANAGVVKWSLGQAYASLSSGAFHVATSKLQSNDSGAKLTVTTAGKVGIGTNLPDEALSLFGSANNVRLRIDSQNLRRNNYIGVTGADNLEIAADEDNAGSGSGIRFRVDGSERVRIDDGGHVGVGTDNPDCNMHVMKASAGSMSADGNAVLALENSNHCVLNMMTPTDKSCYIMMGDPDDANAGQIRYDNNNNALSIDVNGAERGRIDSSGRVLIGTTTEGNASADDLTVANSGSGGITIRTGTSANGSLYFSDATVGAGEYAGVVEYVHSTNSLKLYSNATLGLTIDSSQNATFAAQITVNGGFYLGGEFGLFNGSTNASRYIDCGLGDGNALTIRGCSGGDANHETLASFTRNGGVVLAFDNATKFQTTAAGVTVTGAVSDSTHGNVRDIPATTKTSGYTLVAGDFGKVVYISTGGVTIPNSVMSGGNVVTIINNSGSDQTITQASGLTLYNTADASTGNRTLAGRGMCTLWFQGGSTAYISGAGLS